jgi:hypothetical protein
MKYLRRSIILCDCGAVRRPRARNDAIILSYCDKCQDYCCAHEAYEYNLTPTYPAEDDIVLRVPVSGTFCFRKKMSKKRLYLDLQKGDELKFLISDDEVTEDWSVDEED